MTIVVAIIELHGEVLIGGGRRPVLVPLNLGDAQAEATRLLNSIIIALLHTYIGA